MDRRLVALTGAWGTRHGGINTFNTGLMKALGRVADGKYKIVCPVQEAAPKERNDVWSKHKVELIETGLAMDDMSEPALNKLGSLLGLERDEDAKTRSATVWLGHDDKTGSVAIALRRRFGGRAILINHMNHGSYQGFKKGDSSIAQQKKTMQRNLFSQADFCFAVGPRLTNELCQLLSVEPRAPGVAMLVPGLDDPMDYDVKWLDKPPHYFGGFAAGRLGREDDRIKQGRLAFRAFATAVEEARRTKMLPRLANAARGCLMGAEEGQEKELLRDMQRWVGGQLPMSILSFSEDRKAYFQELAGSDFAMMLSWHEGFGLTGWEAISARVPLILGKNSGLWEFLRDHMNGLGYEQCVFPLDIDGNLPEDEKDENHSSQDVDRVVAAIKILASNAEQAKSAAIRLRDAIHSAGWTWDRAAREFVEQMDILLKECTEVDLLPDGAIVRLDLPEQESPPEIPHSPVLDWVVDEVVAELRVESCRSIAKGLLGDDVLGFLADSCLLRTALLKWFAKSGSAVKRIELLEKALAFALQCSRQVTQGVSALLSHGERLLGLIALTAVRPEVLPTGSDFAAELYEIGIKTLVGIELYQAAINKRAEIRFVWLFIGEQKDVVSERQFRSAFLENAWDDEKSSKELTKELVVSQGVLLTDQTPNQRQIDRANYIIGRKGIYIALSPDLGSYQAFLRQGVRQQIAGTFPNLSIVLYNPNEESPDKVFGVNEGELTGAIQLFLEMLDEHRKA